MSKTSGKKAVPTPEYRKAETGEVGESSSNTHRVRSTSRSIATSRTEGTIKVIVINKPDRTQSIDKSTS